MKLIIPAFAFVTFAGTALATGPAQQQVPWRPAANNQFSTLNSVVALARFGGNETGEIAEGTGTIIGKYQSGNDAWICILTADHVVRGNPIFLNVQFGDVGSAPAGVPNQNLNVTFGADGNGKYLQRSGEDLGLLGVRLGSIVGDDPATSARRQFFERLTPVAVDAVAADDLITTRRNFSNVGYGGTGTFTATGMQAITNNNAAPFQLTIDSKKRFQNNRFERLVGVSDTRYTYSGVQADFNMPAVAGFLASEGAVFGGDSGSPLFQATTTTQQVDAITRPGDNNWEGGDMSLYSNALVAVMTRANTRPNLGDATSRDNPFNTTTMTAIPITGVRADWINEWCAYVPSPATAAIFGLAGLSATRRRRIAM
jgi:hypothetical protein